ncbi:helix-turn-helix transcriptional regulator [Streptomyces axinellae]|uniref:Helix-turn-helix transcriptional regulator n=1 Tax=Streptomyces axinellae TaxID=552788 RepID=A0ABP6CXH8_9ACTN
MGKTGPGGNSLTGAEVTRRFGADVRRVRLARGLKQHHLADGSGYSISYVSKVESGDKVPSEPFAEACDLILGTVDLFTEARRRLLSGENVPDWFVPYMALEAQADKILDFSPTFPMGMLQTEAYGRAVLQAGRLTAQGENVEAVLAARLDRRKLLESSTAPDVWVVLTESCLRTPVGPAAVMREQLDYLVEMAEHPRITMQVLPFSAGASPCASPYTMLRGDGKWMVYVEFPYGGRSYDDEPFLTECVELYDLIRARALGPEASIECIRNISKEYGDD